MPNVNSGEDGNPISFIPPAISSGMIEEPVVFIPVECASGQFDAPTSYIPTKVSAELYDSPTSYIPTKSSSALENEPIDYAPADIAAPRPRELVSGRPHTEGNVGAVFRAYVRQNISLKVVGGTAWPLAALGTGTKVLIEAVILECTLGVGITVDAAVSIYNGAGDQVLAPTTLTNFRTTGQVFSLRPSSGSFFVPIDSSVILVVNTPAQGTTLLVQAHVIAALIP